MYSKEYPEFITVTCLNWNPLLADDKYKSIVVESLKFLVKDDRISVYAFVIMQTHFHLIWQIKSNYRRDEVQRDFLKYTGQQILKELRNGKASAQLNELKVNAKDRKYQVWERNSLGIPLWSGSVLYQKVNYIHNNPVSAGLCKYPEDYKYSSARFYLRNEKSWDFLVHCEG